MDINSYFYNLATEHVLLNHSPESKSFFRSYSSATVLLDNEFHKNLRYATNNVLISQFNGDASLPVPSEDFPRQSVNGTLFILSRIADGVSESARIRATGLRDDILARLRKDMREETISRHFQITAIQSQTIGRIADNFYAIALFIAYQDKYIIEYDQNIWQPLIS